MGFSYIFLVLVIIINIAVPLIFGLVKNKGKTQYKLTANICSVMLALVLSFAVQFLLGASLTNNKDTQETNQSNIIDDGLTTGSNTGYQLNVKDNFICGLAGSAVFVIIIFSTYKLQHRLEVNKLIKENKSS